ncbi:MAG: hypothetical protein ACR5K4_02785 [Sodalis sp. (in: enterobacteria)]
MKKEFKGINSAVMDLVKPHTIYNLLVTNSKILHCDVTPAEGYH